MDYLNPYEPTRGGRENCVASDFKQTLLSALVDEIEKIDELPVVNIPQKSSPSKSRGGGEVEQRRKERFWADALLPYSVCDTAYDLSTKQHNILCLLRGILKEWLPAKDYLGTPLPEIVRVLMLDDPVLFYWIFLQRMMSLSVCYGL